MTVTRKKSLSLQPKFSLSPEVYASLRTNPSNYIAERGESKMLTLYGSPLSLNYCVAMMKTKLHQAGFRIGNGTILNAGISTGLNQLGAISVIADVGKASFDLMESDNIPPEITDELFEWFSSMPLKINTGQHSSRDVSFRLRDSIHVDLCELSETINTSLSASAIFCLMVAFSKEVGINSRHQNAMISTINSILTRLAVRTKLLRTLLETPELFDGELLL